jgi:membrane carboxypeptidase/penicillin-binding protein PbpC
MTKISRSLGEAPLLKESKLGLAPELARRINSLPALDLSSIKPIQTPIDREAQTQALALLREQSEGAILVLDNRTGEALVYASLDPEKGSLPTKRLPIGSAFLPFLVGMGLEERVIQWSAPEIRESIRNEKTMDSLYGRLGGALALERKMPQMGLLSFKSGSEFWPSAFGVQPWFELDTSLEELVQAYLIVARQGVTADMKIVSLDERTSKERIVFSPGVALQIASGLAESSKAYWQSGFSSVAGEDWAWSLAFTTRFTIGALARDQVKAELLRQGMSDYLHAEELRLAQKRTAPIAPAPQIFSPVKVPEKTSYDALALKSAAPIRPSPKVEAKSAPNSLGRIRNPRDGASISMRLNSPINFRMQPYDGRLVWILNGRTLGTAKEVGAWRPSPGDWRLTLRDARGTLIDEVLFEVR